MTEINENKIETNYNYNNRQNQKKPVMKEESLKKSENKSEILNLDDDPKAISEKYFIQNKNMNNKTFLDEIEYLKKYYSLVELENLLYEEFLEIMPQKEALVFSHAVILGLGDEKTENDKK